MGIQSNFENEKYGRGAFKAFLILLVVLVIGGIGFGALSILSQPGKVLQKTFDADNMIYNYEWFKDIYNDYLSAEKKIATAEQEIQSFRELAGDRSAWTFEDKTEDSRLSSVLQGLRNHKDDLAAQYNANSSKANRSIFKRDLPERLE